ncbi:hypothetical protein B0H16DRAFT_1461566 [Mycena metata]|uniref:Uncharacterized protein n=1 Tax=Mycena metata TaxID=1033252 RepID=A0AAD7ITC7_9AGAR|nr:hypothetical protein B0H16DRAFT_1461566 [Mycena metata]
MVCQNYGSSGKRRKGPIFRIDVRSLVKRKRGAIGFFPALSGAWTAEIFQSALIYIRNSLKKNEKRKKMSWVETQLLLVSIPHAVEIGGVSSSASSLGLGRPETPEARRRRVGDISHTGATPSYLAAEEGGASSTKARGVLPR